MTVFKALSAERERQGISLYELGKRTGTSPARVSDILDGTTANPGILTVARVLDALGKDLKWLAFHLQERRTR